jgi:hypothetical protein
LKVWKRGKEIAQRTAVDCCAPLQRTQNFSTIHRRMSSEKAKIQPLRAVPDADAPRETPTLPWDTAATSAEPAEQSSACEFCYGSGMEVVAGKGARLANSNGSGNSGNSNVPLSINYRINAGRIPREHWIQDKGQGGGRIVGEVCHFIDLMHFLTGAVTTRVYAEALESRSHESINEDSVFITLRFSDGSNGSIAYMAEGDKAMPKERLEIFGGGKVFVLDDFRSATLYHKGRIESLKLRNQDKGQADEVRAVCEMVLKGTAAPIALDDLSATTRATFRILDSLRTGQAMNV